MADTTVWSNFAHAHAPHLVTEVFPGVESPPAVLEEVRLGRRLGYLPPIDLGFIKVLELTQRETGTAELLETRLGPGEAACIAVAQARMSLLLTDDRAARRIAREMKVEVTGTLGVLVRLVERGQVAANEADVLLGRMIRAGYRSPVDSIAEVP